MTTLKTLTNAALACALVAGFAVSTPSYDTAPTANSMTSQQAKQLSMPVSDYGDPDVVNIPVVR